MAAIPDLIRAEAVTLPSISSPAFGAAFDRFAGGARVILMGEASHGTAEFYRARAAITKRLVKEHGFNIVAVEADWPDASTIDRHVRLKPPVTLKEPPFRRFPTWMWRNQEVSEFVAWLKEHNSNLSPEKRTGFYGLDLYSIYSSINAVIRYLERVDAEAAKRAKKLYGCLTPWVDDPARYGLEAMARGRAPCEDSVIKVLTELLKNRLDYVPEDGEDFLDAEQNAHLVADAESYYRAMYHGSAESWNLRDTHMFETLERLLKREGTKAVVWAHNSHIGDARNTGMGMDRKEINIGQLCRERFGDEARLIGFGTYTGTVAAAHDWDEPMQIMKVRPSREDSYEILAHKTGIPSFLLDLRKGKIGEELRKQLLKPRLERFIGVVYRPETELWSHYSKAILPKQFDGYVWFEETKAVKALETEEIHTAVAADDTYPFGL